MKRLILFFAFLLSFVAGEAQNHQFIPGYGFRWNRGLFDVTLGMPYADSVPGSPSTNVARPGYLFYSEHDSSVNYWTGYQWIKSSTGGGGGSSTLSELLQNGNTADTSIRISTKSTVGTVFDYDFSAGSFSSWTDNTSTGTVTAAAGKTTIGGTLAYNLNNSLSQAFYFGVNKWRMQAPTFVVTQKDNTSFGFAIRIAGTVGSAPDMFAHFLLSDTAGYIAFTVGNSLPNYSTSANTRNAYTFKWSLGDSLQPTIQRIDRDVIITLKNKTTGAEMSLTIPQCTVTVGTLSMYFYSQWELVGHFKLIYDEVYQPAIAWLGDSNMWGVSSSSIGQSYYNQVMSAVPGGYSLMAAPFERALEGTYRFNDLLLIKPKLAVWGYGVNVDVNIDSFSKRTCRFVELCQANSIGVALLGLIPQTATSVVIRNDTLQAIATRYGVTYINISTPLMGPSGTAMDALYNTGDGVHIGPYGHNVAAKVIYNALASQFTGENPFRANHLPISSDPPYMIGQTLDGDFVRTFRDSANKYIQNIRPVAGISNAQRASLNLIGEFVFDNTGGGLFKVLGNGNFANPNFKVEAGVVTVSANLVAGNFAVTSSQPTFSGGNVIWSGSPTNLMTSPVVWMTNNPNGNGITSATTFDNNTADPSSSAYNIIRLRRNGTTVANLTRDGGGWFNDTLTYATNMGSKFGLYSLVDKNYVDSVAGTIVGGGGGLANPMTTTGDMIYSSSGSTAARRGIGSTGDVLMPVGGVPTWVSNPFVVNNYGSAQATARFWISGGGRSDSSFRGRTTGAMNGAHTAALIAYASGSATTSYAGMGYDATLSVGWIQSLTEGTAYRDFIINPGGGKLGVGALVAAPTTMLQIQTNQYPAIKLLKTGVNPWYIGNRTEGAGTDFQISYNTTDWLQMKITGETGFGAQSPSGWVDIAAGTTGIGQLILRSGVVQSSPTSGALTNVSGDLKFYNGAQKRLPIFNDAAPSSGQVLYGNGTDFTLGDHGNIGGLGDDDHTQYLLIAGRSGGQSVNGGTAADNSLLLRGTAATSSNTGSAPNVSVVVGNGAGTTSMIWYNNGTIQIGASGTPITGIMSAAATLDFPSTAVNASSDLTVTVTGAAVGDVVSLGVPHGSVNANTIYTAWVSATNTVTVRHSNLDLSAPSDPASNSFRVQVNKF